MHLPTFLNVIALLVLSTTFAQSQDTINYKKVDATNLYLEIIKPHNFDEAKVYPAMVFFFGGGWTGGSRTHFSYHAEHFAEKGIVCFLADYRTKKNSNTTPFESLKDAKSAMRYIRENASKLNIDPNKIIASGGSAGGHLAAATALITGFNDELDNLEISCVPNALVLYNPVIDNGPGGYGYERIGDAYPTFSPLHNIKKGAPPTVFFLGTKDKLIPVETAKYYQVVMQKIGSRCDLHLYENQDHGFFNFANSEYFKKTLATTDLFLQSLGY